MNSEVGPLRFGNSHKEFINWIKTQVGDIPVARVTTEPAVNGRKIVVINGGGQKDPYGFSSVIRMNVLVWGGSTYEETEDYALEVDSLISAFNTTAHQTNIISLTPVFSPVPTGDPDGTQAPVYSMGYDLWVAAYNNPSSDRIS